MGSLVSNYVPTSENKENSKAVEILRATSVQLPEDMKVLNRYITNWANNSRDIMWDVNFQSKGVFTVAVGLANKKIQETVIIEVEINGMSLSFNLDPEMSYEKCTKIVVGVLCVKNPGFAIIRLRAKGLNADSAGNLYYLELSGPAIQNLQNHTWSSYCPVLASDVYLVWHTKSTNINMFYNEITISDHNTDALFVACGFYRGYVGLQNGIIYFAIESPGLDPNLPEDKIPQRYKVKTVSQMYGTRIEYHSGQTRASCTFYYQWKTKETYRFVLSSKSCNTENSIMYSAFFYKNDTKEWSHLATFKVTELPRSFSELYSSIENCKSYHGFNNYEAHFGPAMIHVKGKGWAHLVKAQFQQREDENLPTDVNAGVTRNNKFYLSTGQPAKKSIDLYDTLVCENDALPEDIFNFDPDVTANEYK